MSSAFGVALACASSISSEMVRQPPWEIMKNSSGGASKSLSAVVSSSPASN